MSARARWHPWMGYAFGKLAITCVHVCGTRGWSMLFCVQVVLLACMRVGVRLCELYVPQVGTTRVFRRPTLSLPRHRPMRARTRPNSPLSRPFLLRCHWGDGHLPPPRHPAASPRPPRCVFHKASPCPDRIAVENHRLRTGMRHFAAVFPRGLKTG